MANLIVNALAARAVGGVKAKSDGKFVTSPWDLVKAVSSAIAQVERRRRERDALRRMDDRLLNDIGLTRADVDRAIDGDLRR